MNRIGIDIGSTTAKMAVVDDSGNIVFSRYLRHNARIGETLSTLCSEVIKAIGDEEVAFAITGSIGMGIAQKCSLPFVQEVIAASKATHFRCNKAISTLIDIGGEDAKVVFFNDKGEAVDLRMNGNCAAGTGAFIDQMAIILGESIEGLNSLALKADRIFPIASRCGVFCKTDIQNLIAKKISKEDISASIFHAVAVQTVVTLAHGYDIKPPVLFCGGPLSFIPALRKEFTDYLNLSENDIIVPEDGKLFPALGTALSCGSEKLYRISELDKIICDSFGTGNDKKDALPPIFKDEESHNSWLKQISSKNTERAGLEPGKQEVYLGIDSGSTTTKVVFTDNRGRILFSFYSDNNGDPVGTASEGIRRFNEKCRETGTDALINGSCSTGYGEDLIKAAFRLDHGIIETIAHYLAASYLDPEVSFILDIGGQDMKAIYVENKVINRIEINEACSSGCGSFIETFAKSLGYSVGDFAEAACRSSSPCDLGTRCTVFMNSKVKQVLREGYGIEDIAAGLAYSVVKNCLYKVLKITDTSSLGKHIVVQGGTMKNDAVVKALENLSGARVSRSDCPELMGAYGCALYSIASITNHKQKIKEECAQTI
jgi:predicted CoA-substrate-specific enzyme activase